MVKAHDQVVTHRYRIHYPEHGPRKDDPHYIDFNHYHRLNRATARCHIGVRVGFEQCLDSEIDASGKQSDLELHHAHIEQSLINGVSFEALEHDYPGISNPNEVGAWVQSDANFRWLCTYHHRSTAAGAHAISHSEWEASQYVPNLTSPAP